MLPRKYQLKTGLFGLFLLCLLVTGVCSFARDPLFPSSAGSISLSFLIPSWVVHPVIDRLVADKF